MKVENKIFPNEEQLKGFDDNSVNPTSKIFSEAAKSRR